MLIGLALLLLFQARPQSAWVTAAMRDTVSLAASSKAAGERWLTHAEKTGYAETGDYAEAVRFHQRLEKASPYARLIEFGRTPMGRPIYALVASKDRAFTPALAARTGKPVVLLQNGIHPGENGGKDASMMLLRDVLVTKRHAGWLDRLILISIVVFNVDGLENTSPYNRINENGPARMGFRATSQRLNLNRDYLKADTPEMRAWLKLYTAWRPDLLIDNHVTNGSDHQYDVLIAAHTSGDIAKPVGGWVRERYTGPLLEEMSRLGHVVGWYTEYGARGDPLPPMNFSPRYSNGYAAAQNRAALLVETHSLKPFRTRVWSHYDTMRASLHIAAVDAAGLREAGRIADREMAAIKPGTPVLLQGVPGRESEPYTLRLLGSETYRGAASGGAVVRYLPKPVDRPVRLILELSPKLAPAAPVGYLIPRQWAALTELLRLHGVVTEETGGGRAFDVEITRFSGVRFAPAPFEGRFMVTGFDTRISIARQSAEAGTVFVPVAQRAGKVAMHLLEPEAPDSALRWGFMHSIFERKESFSPYIFEPVAAAMLRDDAALRAEFEAKLKVDESFAGDPGARLHWLFERSPYSERDRNLYPVLRVVNMEPVR
jgi:murein tripeptide amidase MpaA